MRMHEKHRVNEAVTMLPKWSFSLTNYSVTIGGTQKVTASNFTKVQNSFFGNMVNLVVLDTQVPTIEKSHSSPGTSKPSPSEGQSQSHSHGHARSHGASRSSKSAARQQHQDSGTGSGRGAAIATGDAPQQSQQQQPPPPQRLQPSKPRRK